MERDSRGGHNRKKINENFFKEWSPQMAYILGFIFADGAVEDCRESSRTCYLSLANNDLDLLQQIKSAMASQNSVEIRRPRIVNIFGKEYLCKTSYCVRIGNIEIYNDLVKLGLCPRKSLVIELPTIPNIYFQYFLRGYFDGDGCINIEKTKKNRMNIIFTSGSKVFLEQIQDRIKTNYLQIKSYIGFGSGAFRLRYSYRNALLLANYMYQDITSAPYLKYKYQRFANFLNSKKISLRMFKC